MKAEKSKVDTLIAIAPTTRWEMHKRWFIFLPKIVNMWSMETTNKGHLINKPNKWYQMIPKGHLSLMIVFYDCFFIEFLIVFYDWLWLSFDCLWWFFLIEFWLSLMIVFYDYFWLSFDCLRWLLFIEFWFSLMIAFDWVFYCLWWLSLIIDFDDCV